MRKKGLLLFCCAVAKSHENISMAWDVCLIEFYLFGVAGENLTLESGFSDLVDNSS